MDWESQRLQILEMHHYWPQLIQRVESYPPSLAVDFRTWSSGLLAKAYLESDAGGEAQRVLLSLLWHGEEAPQDQSQVRIWRAWIIRSYLAQGQIDDAYTAVERFQQDYGAQQSSERLLRARILLMLKRYDEARFLLHKEDQYLEAKALLLLINLRTGKAKPPAVIREARWLGANDNATPVDVYLSWAVVYDAARLSDDQTNRVLSLEHLLVFHSQSEWQGLFDFDADSLWAAYEQLAVDEANAHKVLMGEDEKWLKLAKDNRAENPHITRAIYAHLAISSRDQTYREQALEAFSQEMLSLPSGKALYKHLFLQSRRFGDYRQLPPQTRYILIDLLIGEGDVTTASALLETQLEPPHGEDRIFWQMRSARVLILAGSHQAGIEMLGQIFRENQQISQQNLDRINQVVFDLQTIGEHRAAIEIFNQLLARSNNNRFKRELLFWIADSHMSLGEYEKAALLYIQSANYIVGQEGDLWGQSAQFKAAEALEKAGLLEDARVIYKRLLKSSQDDSQKALLRHKLQQLLLK